MNFYVHSFPIGTILLLSLCLTLETKACDQLNTYIHLFHFQFFSLSHPIGMHT